MALLKRNRIKARQAIGHRTHRTQDTLKKSTREFRIVETAKGHRITRQTVFAPSIRSKVTRDHGRKTDS